MEGVNKATYRRLGKSGLRVSVPILGFMGFGSSKWINWVKDPQESLPIIKRAYDLGVTTWDTANTYSNGESEKVVALAMKEYGIPREELVIMTKLHFPVGESGDAVSLYRPFDRHYTNNMGLSRGAIYKAVDASLRRLETDYIDVLQIHRYDYDVEPEEVMSALNDLVKAGKVRYIGASTMWLHQFATLQHVAELHGWTKFVSMQNHYNLIYREEEREMIPFCNKTGVGLIPWSPLERGALARPVSSSSTGETQRQKIDKSNGYTTLVNEVGASQAIIARVEEIAKKKGWTMAEVSLAWVMSKVASPIVGVSSIERLEESVRAAGRVLDDDETAMLEELYTPMAPVGIK